MSPFQLTLLLLLLLSLRIEGLNLCYQCSDIDKGIGFICNIDTSNNNLFRPALFECYGSNVFIQNVLQDRNERLLTKGLFLCKIVIIFIRDVRLRNYLTLSVTH
jgi:hypothetical protein